MFNIYASSEKKVRFISWVTAERENRQTQLVFYFHIASLQSTKEWGKYGIYGKYEIAI